MAEVVRAQPEVDSAAPGDRFLEFLQHRGMPLRVALLGVLLTAPSLFIGFHLDDYVHRYLLSDLPGAAALRVAYESPFGIANGEPPINHWQIEQGYAPWWTPPDLLISLFRPISELTHRLDAALWPNAALPMHAHNLLWYFALCAAAALLYRSVCGSAALAGLSALLYAIDYTHGFAVGWIANRNALVAAVFGVLSLWAHHEARTRRSRGHALGSVVLLACALLSGEGALAIFGYLIAHAMFLDPARGTRRFMAIAPHALVILGWRVLYNAIGRGAHGSGLYLDPVREPLRFAFAAFERAPLLLMGEMLAPPAESPLFLGSPWSGLILGFAALVTLWMALAVLPLVRSSERARFFALGLVLSLVPACTTHPHSRLLFFAGIGALGLLSELWHGALTGAPWLPAGGLRRVTRSFAAVGMGFHLFVSPLLLALMSCSIAFTGTIQRGVESAMAQSAGRDLVVMSAPEYFYVKLIPVQKALAGAPGPRRLRALSFGGVPLAVTRDDLHTLHVVFEGGLLREPLLELYRAADDPMPVGSRVQLQGLTIEVTGQTPEGLIASARFVFDSALEHPRFRFLAWNGERFAPYRPPPVGESNRLPAAQMSLGL